MHLTNASDLTWCLLAGCPWQAMYCSVECQRAHWKKGGHKSACKRRQKAPEEGPGEGLESAYPNPGDIVKVAGLVKSTALNGMRGTVQPRDTWKRDDPMMWTVDRVNVLLDTMPPKYVLLAPRNIIVVYAVPCDTCTDESTRSTQEAGFAARGGHGGTCTICLDSEPKPMQRGCACRGDAGLAHLHCLIRAAAHEQKSTRNIMAWSECGTCHQLFNGAISRGLAAEFLRRSEDHPENPMEFAVSASHASKTLLLASKFVEAEAFCRKKLATLQQMGCEDFCVNLIRYQLAKAVGCQGRHAEAQDILERVLSDTVREHGKESMATLEVLTSQGDNLGGQGKFDAAILIHTRVLEVSVRKLGKAHVFTLACGIRLARSFVVSGEHAQAVELYRVYMPIMMRILGPEHNTTGLARLQYGRALMGLSQMVEAEVEFAEALRSLTRVYGAQHPITMSTAMMLSACRAKMATS